MARSPLAFIQLTPITAPGELAQAGYRWYRLAGFNLATDQYAGLACIEASQGKRIGRLERTNKYGYRVSYKGQRIFLTLKKIRAALHIADGRAMV